MSRSGAPEANTPGTAPEAVQPEALIVVGGSAGCLTPLKELAAGLPADLPAAMLLVVHRGERSPSKLAEILNRAGPLPTSAAEDGELIRRGRIYVAQPGRHLMSHHGRLRLRGGPRVNRCQPAIDVLFASTARWTDGRTVAVVLSGVLDDGAVGAALIEQAGGRVLAQDPAEAQFGSMPAAALAAAAGSRALPGAQLAGGVLAELASIMEEAEAPALRMHGWETEMDMADSDDLGYLAAGESALTRLACPDCGGGLAQVDLPQISYFRCHIGHQFGPRSLAAAQAEAVESKLWSAVAALEEQATLLQYLDKRQTSPPPEGERLAGQIVERAAVLREQVRNWTATPSGSLAELPD